jgi:hypothetical protein
MGCYSPETVSLILSLTINRRIFERCKYNNFKILKPTFDLSLYAVFFAYKERQLGQILFGITCMSLSICLLGCFTDNLFNKTVEITPVYLRLDFKAKKTRQSCRAFLVITQ